MATGVLCPLNPDELLECLMPPLIESKQLMMVGETLTAVTVGLRRGGWKHWPAVAIRPTFASSGRLRRIERGKGQPEANKRERLRRMGLRRTAFASGQRRSPQAFASTLKQARG